MAIRETKELIEQMSDSERNKGGKGLKRDKPDLDNSREEEEQRAFQRSRVVLRTPEKEDKSVEMEEIKRLIMETNREITESKREIMSELVKFKTEVRNGMEEIRCNIKKMREEITQNKGEINNIGEKINEMEKKWEGEMEEVVNGLHAAEEKIERTEKEKIRNNLVVTGFEAGTDDEDELKGTMESFIQRELQVEVKVRKAYKIGQRRQILEMQGWNDKLKILGEKRKLKGTKIFIDSELTYREREIQRKIREIAKKERDGGATVKVKYMKLEINGRVLNWDDREKRLKEVPKGSENERRGAKK